MSILEEAKEIREKIVAHRRYIHENAEIHLDLPKTSAYVEEQLRALGYEPQRIGTSGIVALAGGKKPGKVFLIRADMDALPIQEQSGVPFACTNGNMHACGHDGHTAMLLGAAELLKRHEDEIEGTVKLMFQPAEETLAGARMMLENGVLENPRVDAAMMMHGSGSAPMKTGTVLLAKQGAAAADWFKITVTGKGGHGAMPDVSIDPLNVIAHIHIALQAINARETSPADTIALTVGQMHGGSISNVIPDAAMLSGTLRTNDEEVRKFAKQRIEEIAKSVAHTFRAEATVEYERECPCFAVNAELVDDLSEYTHALVGDELFIDLSKVTLNSKTMGSEDFAWISEQVPSACVSLATGGPEVGCCYPLHHPKAMFDEDAYPVGAAVYANCAIEWLRHHK